MNKYPAFSLFEFVIAVSMVAILATVTYLVFRPGQRVDDATYARTLVEIQQVKEAIGYYSLYEGGYPAETPAGVAPAGLEKYVGVEFDWSKGPIPGTVWDYDNWQGLSCVEPEVNDTVQITLRNVPGRNPDGSNEWAWYAPASPGSFGAADCESLTGYNKGECVTCESFDIDNPPT